MRFNDEVQFTLCLVRTPAPVVLPEPVAQPRVFTECMTQGDMACFTPTMRALYDDQHLASSAKGFKRMVYVPDPDVQKAFAAGFDSVNGVRKLDGYDDLWANLWAKYNKEVEAVYAKAPHVALLDGRQVTLYPDPDANFAVGEVSVNGDFSTDDVKHKATTYFAPNKACGEIAPKGSTNGEGLRDALLRVQMRNGARKMPWMQCSDDGSGGPPKQLCDWIAENGGWAMNSAYSGKDGIWFTLRNDKSA